MGFSGSKNWKSSPKIGKVLQFVVLYFSLDFVIAVAFSSVFSSFRPFKDLNDFDDSHKGGLFSDWLILILFSYFTSKRKNMNNLI